MRTNLNIFKAESPRFMLIEANKEDEAKSTLVKLRGTNEVRTRGCR